VGVAGLGAIGSQVAAALADGSIAGLSLVVVAGPADRAANVAGGGSQLATALVGDRLLERPLHDGVADHRHHAGSEHARDDHRSEQAEEQQPLAPAGGRPAGRRFQAAVERDERLRRTG
jgi:hypothetical protein